MKTSAQRPPPPGHPARNTRRAGKGFTLVEVIVALAVTAIALVAGLKATAALTDNARRQDALLLAQICADNRLIEWRLSRRLPDVGNSSDTCAQAGRSFVVAQQVHPTPNPNFRRVEVAVSEGSTPIVQVAAIVGRN